MIFFSYEHVIRRSESQKLISLFGWASDLPVPPVCPGGSAKTAIPGQDRKPSDDLLAWIRGHREIPKVYTLTPRKSQHRMTDCYTGS